MLSLNEGARDNKEEAEAGNGQEVRESLGALSWYCEDPQTCAAAIVFFWTNSTAIMSANALARVHAGNWNRRHQSLGGLFTLCGAGCHKRDPRHARKCSQNALSLKDSPTDGNTHLARWICFKTKEPRPTEFGEHSTHATPRVQPLTHNSLHQKHR